MLRTGLSSVSHRAVAQGNKPLAMAPSRTIFHTGDKGREEELKGELDMYQATEIHG